MTKDRDKLFSKMIFIKIEGEHQDELNVCDEGTFPQIEKKAQKAMREGRAVTWNWPHGPTQWFEDYEILDLDKSGSAIYTWDKSGNRVKCERYLITRDKDGEVTKEFTKHVYKSL